MNKLIRLLQGTRDWLESDAPVASSGRPATAVLVCRVRRRTRRHHCHRRQPEHGRDDYHPTRLEGAKRAVRRTWTPRRHEPPTLVGVVDFHGEAEPVSHPLPVGEQRRALCQSLNRLHTGCGTNIGAGLQLAGQELALVPTPANPTVILLTDGDSNQGPDPVQVAQKLKARGIQIDVIGIGGSPAEVNEQDLKRIASVTNRQLRYWFIESANGLVERFEALALREIK